MELITTHTHSTFCEHAQDSLEDMVQAAISAGISTMAATEHYPISKAFDETLKATMLASRLDDYIAAVRTQQELHPDFDLLLGCELDWFGSLEDRDIAPEDLACFDVVLGSVHFIDRWLFNSTRFEERWLEADVDAAWLRYIDLWCDAASSDRPFSVMAHPDVVKKFGFKPSFDLRPHYARMAEAALAGGRMVEVNTAGIRDKVDEFYPAPALLEEFARAGVPCTVGTDAHRKEHVAAGIREAYAAMYDAGYRHVTVPTKGRGRRQIEIA